jgi:hypothetical protein
MPGFLLGENCPYFGPPKKISYGIVAKHPGILYGDRIGGDIF